MGIVVIGASFVDIKGFPQDTCFANGRNVGRVEYVHGGVARDVVEDIANVELRPTFPGIVDDTPLGAGDAFCAGVSVGLTYGKKFDEAIKIGSILAVSVISSSENVCPRFLPEELGLDVRME